MRIYTPFVFLFQAITIGLAAAFLILVWKPELIDKGRNVVEIVEQAEPLVKGTLQNGPFSYADAVAKAAPSVVNIYTRKMVAQQSLPLFDDPFFRRFFGDQFSQPRQREESSLGSGVIINEQGYLLTNNHVIEGAEEIQVALQDGRSTDAEVVGADPEADLAVLKVKLAELPAITLGQSDNMRVGDVVLAIGNPFGVGQTVTMGIVSATRRSDLGINTFENFIQTDAAINPGNSGGALINAHGELVGINTAIFSRSGGSQGIGFAIPVSLAKGIMTQIIETGRVSRGWLGVEIQELTPELAESFGLEKTEGVLIAGLVEDGPADSAGMKAGDVITQVAEEKVQNVREALNIISRQRPGTDMTVQIIRGGKAQTLSVEMGERPPVRPVR